jgi:hypothetical protein
MRCRWMVVFVLFVSPALAVDWNAPIVDESGNSIPDWMNSECRGKDPTKDKCDKILTIGTMTARLLCGGTPQGKTIPPEEAAVQCDLGRAIMKNPKTEINPDQLKFSCDALANSPSHLIISEGCEILGCKKPLK